MPALAVSEPHGQLGGQGLEGFYHGGRRLLSRMRLSVAGAEPVAVQGRMTGAAQARFVGTVRTAAGHGPDPVVIVERLRHAAGVERIALRSRAARPLRLPVELELGTDLAELGAIATGSPGPALQAAVHENGLRWSTRGASAAVTAWPPPGTVLASAGVLRWEFDLLPGEDRTVELRIAFTSAAPAARLDAPATRLPAPRAGAGGHAVGGYGAGSQAVGGYGSGTAAGAGAHPPGGYASGSHLSGGFASSSDPGQSVVGGYLAGSGRGQSSGGYAASAVPVRPQPPWGPVVAVADDARVAPLLACALDDLDALLLRDPDRAGDLYPAAGAPWRCGLAPADALWAARILLPLGTRLAAGTLRALARAQVTAPGPELGLIRGALRDSGPHLPPRSTGAEATLLFPVVLAEARLWGLPDTETERLLPAAERCLAFLRAGPGPLVPDPAPDAPYRIDTQAHAHRAAMLGADLLDGLGRPGAGELRERARELRERVREAFWIDDRSGGRPAAALTPDGRPVASLGSAAAHLLDPGLTSGGRLAEGLLDKVQTEQVARLLGAPSLDSGWGLRSLGAKEPGYNPFGHRAGAVCVHETAVGVHGLFAAGYEKEAAALLHGVLDAAAEFGNRLPEMYAGEHRTEGSAPLPHPTACRPSATAAAAVVHLLASLAGVRPDAPAGTVCVQPAGTAPLGAVQLSGLQVAGEPFGVRVSRLGMAMVEEAGEGLQLGG
ncbi:glycogen debranching N-terminal domain-containing protein [Streptomyces sp. NPDC051940]|uniref:glycogen debranching N-terminal domain-containing protein n=1 Tax=Streptomyces sp. NPDC051940 TaxID=3155675 RepID=UPI00343D3ABA